MNDLTPMKRAPDPRSEYKLGMSNQTQKGLFLLGGIALGAIIVLVTLHFGSSDETIPKVVVKEVPVGISSTANPKQPEQEGSPTLPETGGAEATPKDPTGVIKPFNPFEGNISALPPREIGGALPPSTGPAPTAPPGEKATQTAVTPPAPKPSGSLLVTVNLSVDQADSSLATLRNLAATNKGTAIQFDESATSDEPEGALLFVPAERAGELEKSLSSAGSIAGLGRWSGTAGGRADRIEATALSRLADLRQKKLLLQEKYFDDAPEVVAVSDEIKRIETSLSTFNAHRAGPNMAIFKISFLD